MGLQYFQRPNPYPGITFDEEIFEKGRSTYFHTAVHLQDETVDVRVRLDEFLTDPSDAGAERLNRYMDRQREKVVRRVRSIELISDGFVLAMRGLESEFQPRRVRA